MDKDEIRRTQFLIDQMKQGQRYGTTNMKNAISLYLRSRNYYNALREYLSLQHPNTIRNYFGTLDSHGALSDCENTIKSVFSS